jgi:hypothetical protein
MAHPAVAHPAKVQLFSVKTAAWGAILQKCSYLSLKRRFGRKTEKINALLHFVLQNRPSQPK